MWHHNVDSNKITSNLFGLHFTGEGANLLSPYLLLVQNRFCIELEITQKPGTSGYFISKTDIFGRTYYSLFGSRNSGRIYFRYRLVGSDVPRSTYFVASINDGRKHIMIFSVNEKYEATLSVDGKFLGAILLAGPVDDCGIASAECFLSLGQRAFSSTESSGHLYGTLYSAFMYTNERCDTLAINEVEYLNQRHSFEGTRTTLRPFQDLPGSTTANNHRKKTFTVEGIIGIASAIAGILVFVLIYRIFYFRAKRQGSPKEMVFDDFKKSQKAVVNKSDIDAYASNSVNTCEVEC